MDSNRAEQLLREYADSVSKKPALSQEVEAELRARLTAEVDNERAREGRRHKVWLGMVGLAIAATVAVVFIVPEPLSVSVDVAARLPRATRGGEAAPREDRGAFTVDISANKPAVIHILVLTESGDLLVKQAAEDGQYWRRVEGAIDLEYGLLQQVGETDAKMSPATHVMIIAAQQPMMDSLTDAGIVPDTISVESDAQIDRGLNRIAKKLEELKDCVVIIKPIGPLR